MMYDVVITLNNISLFASLLFGVISFNKIFYGVGFFGLAFIALFLKEIGEAIKHG